MVCPIAVSYTHLVGVEEQIDENTVHATKIITRKASERIIHDAFAYAKEHGRKKVTCVHKANILKMSDGLFLNIFQTIAKEYPDICLLYTSMRIYVLILLIIKMAVYRMP